MRLIYADESGSREEGDELMDQAEAYDGEQALYQELVGILEPQRERLGLTPGGPSVTFYQAARHPGWVI